MASVIVHEQIRKLMEGKRTAKRALVGQGGDAVEPILEALSGFHGRFHPDHQAQATGDLVDALVQIAKKDPRSLAEALAHHVPGDHLVYWALGHSDSRLAKSITKDALDHEDGAIQAVATYHTGRKKKRKPPRRRKPTSRRKPAAKKKAAKRAKKKAAKKRKAARR